MATLVITRWYPFQTPSLSDSHGDFSKIVKLMCEFSVGHASEWASHCLSLMPLVNFRICWIGRFLWAKHHVPKFWQIEIPIWKQKNEKMLKISLNFPNNHRISSAWTAFLFAVDGRQGTCRARWRPRRRVPTPGVRPREPWRPDGEMFPVFFVGNGKITCGCKGVECVRVCVYIYDFIYIYIYIIIYIHVYVFVLWE